MATIHIDRILETCIKNGASDVYLSPGAFPKMCVGERLVDYGSRHLTEEDCFVLMKSITPDRNQEELSERNGTQFQFDFGDAGRFATLVLRRDNVITIDLRMIQQ
jgi:twitching motility protein PilT